MKVYSAAFKLSRLKPSEIIAKSRLALSRPVNSILLGPIAGRAPQSVVPSLDEVSYRSVIKDHIVERFRICGPEIVTYTFPSHYPPEFRREKAFQSQGMFLLKDVFVSPRSGMVWLPEGFILEESVGSLFRIMGWGGNLVEPLLPQGRLTTDTPLVACPPIGYYHWLLETVPALLCALSAVPEARILISKLSPRYLREALAILLGTAYEERIVQSRFPLKVSKLLMPQLEQYSGFVRPGDIEILRNTFAVPGRPSKRLYVSRTKTASRQLPGEENLQTELDRLGFEVVHAEELSFAEQIRRFSQAKIIVAPHGAGLANIIWTSPGCHLLELFPPRFFNDCYARLSMMIGIQYDYVSTKLDGTGNHIRIDEIIAKAKSL